ncbi:unnamed protein product [Amoebophrya sp. A25]|nr:unnamed protein product [Amoebophrya sp. A25]|eukprot:GSA25T00015123001.1
MQHSRLAGSALRRARCGSSVARGGEHVAAKFWLQQARAASSAAAKSSGSLFDHVAMAPPDPILNTAAMFKGDTDTRKVNLGIGAYRTEEGDPWILPVVKRAEEDMLRELSGTGINKEYLPVDGLASLKSACQKLIFGQADARIASVQCLSGTGSLRVLGEFLNANLGCKKLFYSDPTWGNHPTIFEKSGIKCEKYPYYDPTTRACKFDEWHKHVEAAPEGSLYLIHPCAHNPTGVDPSEEQWKEMVATCVAKKHLVILDSAYQGYASGSLEKDRKVIEMFMASDLEFFVCQSFAKNLGLYGERIGMLHVVCKNKDRAEAVLSQLKLVVRPMYSSPPLHGAHLVSKILNTPNMYQQWTIELKEMADRIHEVRSMLRGLLEQKGTPGKWNHITEQIGMFSFTGLTPEQCETLIKEHHIYLLKSGRISLAGLNKDNVGYVADCIHKVVSASAGKKK